MSGDQLAQAAISFRVERRRGLERVVGVQEVHFRRLDAAVDKSVEDEELAGRVLGENDLLAAQIGDGGPIRILRVAAAEDDPVAAVGPSICWSSAARSGCRRATSP